ncbi:MAG: D-alanyl-D-alanine carboxypeptidase [Alphaproteobacteria bacterium]|nr:D-alanyl-D-alanine carboxypeptidase [Alphaproteobacteria bacterium]
MTVSSVPARFGACLALLSILSVTPALAASAGSAPVVLDGKIPLPTDVPPAPALSDVSSYILLDDATGAVIAAKAPHAHLPPASLTKLMTVYLTYQALKADTVKMDQVVPVSVAAWKAGGSRMFIQPGMPVTMQQLIAGLMVDSGNDAAVALAQAVAGTQASFVTMMNHTAGLLHLADTHYVNVDGLPADDHYTSAFDLARLSRVIIASYPDILKVAAQQYYTYNKIRQPNWNPLVFRDSTVDGLKTGLTDASGHCIDATAVRSGRRLIAVVMGGPSWKASADDIEALLDYGYRFFGNQTVMKAGDVVGAIDDPLRNPTHVPVSVTETVVMTLPASKTLPLKKTMTVLSGLKGKIAKGEVVAHVAIGVNGKTIDTVPAVATIAAKPAGLGQRLMYEIKRHL